jgi:hypothetical protein
LEFTLKPVVVASADKKVVDRELADRKLADRKLADRYLKLAGKALLGRSDKLEAKQERLDQ